MTQWFTASLAMLAITSTAQAVDITECGQLVPRGETGILQSDLTCGETVKRCRDFTSVVCTTSADCPNGLGCTAAGIFLDRGAKVDLNGHSLSQSSTSLIGSTTAVQCRYRGHCAVRNGTVKCLNVPMDGVWATRGSIVAEDLTVLNCSIGVSAIGGRAKVTRVSASGNVEGIYAEHVRALDVIASDNSNLGVGAPTSLRASNLRTERNGGSGVYARLFRLDGFESHDNARAGLISGRINGRAFEGRLRNSNVTGNAYQGQPMDILSVKVPVVENTACDWSGLWIADDQPAGPGLGICAQQ